MQILPMQYAAAPTLITQPTQIIVQQVPQVFPVQV